MSAKINLWRFFQQKPKGRASKSNFDECESSRSIVRRKWLNPHVGIPAMEVPFQDPRVQGLVDNKGVEHATNVLPVEWQWSIPKAK